MQYLPEQFGAGLLASRPLGQHLDPALLDEVSQQDPDDTDRQSDIGRHVGDGSRPLAQTQQPAVLGAETQRISRCVALARVHDDRDQVQHLTVDWSADQLQRQPVRVLRLLHHHPPLIMTGPGSVTEADVSGLNRTGNGFTSYLEP